MIEQNEKQFMAIAMAAMINRIAVLEAENSILDSKNEKLVERVTALSWQVESQRNHMHELEARSPTYGWQ